MEEIIKKCLPTYDVVEKLGQGIFGSVYRIKDNLKERAVKVVPIFLERSISYRTPKELDSKISQDYLAVREYYEKIRGEGIIEIYDFHLVGKEISSREARGHLVILMELCPDNLLNHVLDNYPIAPDDALHLMINLAELLNRLSHNHREVFLVTDLKPANLLLNDKGHLLVGDLGGIKRLSSVSSSAKAQFTPNWTAPEVIIKGRRPGIPAVIFSFGLVSYFLWEGALPYEDHDFADRIRRIKKKGIDFKRADIPRQISLLIRQCLHFEPEGRPGDFSEIIQILYGDKVVREDPTIELNDPVIEPASGADDRMPEEFTPPGKPDRPALPPVNPTSGDVWREPLTAMEFVFVPGGRFLMGCGQWDGEGFDNEYPVREVVLYGFWIGKYPVTQGQYQKLMKKNPAFFQRGDQYPVEQISWDDAQAFIEILGRETAGRPAFSLPTETQWEYAARSGGKPEKFAGGNDVDPVAWYIENSEDSTRAVGTKAPNGLGIYDMSGNVWEWCLDIYRHDLGAEGKSPAHSYSIDEINRVRRGGCWYSVSRGCRSANRRKSPQSFRNSNLGFRLAINP